MGSPKCEGFVIQDKVRGKKKKGSIVSQEVEEAM